MIPVPPVNPIKHHHFVELKRGKPVCIDCNAEWNAERVFEECGGLPLVTRLCIVQDSGLQLYMGRYESHIHAFVPWDNEEFGKRYCAKLNEHTDLPFYLSKVELRLIGPMKEYTTADLKKEGIAPLPKENE